MPANKNKTIDIQSTKSDIKRLVDMNPCTQCRVMGLPKCNGHVISGGGGGGGSASSGSSDNKDSIITSGHISNSNEMTISTEELLAFDRYKMDWISENLKPDRGLLEYEAGLLLVKIDMLSGILSFQIKPDLSENDVKAAKEFMNTIQKEFNEFKSTLSEQGINTEKLSIDFKDDVLTINIPNPKYLEMFVKHLQERNLFPVPNPWEQNKKEIGKDLTGTVKKTITPFDAMKEGPKPKGYHDKSD